MNFSLQNTVDRDHASPPGARDLPELQRGRPGGSRPAVSSG